MPSEPTFAVVLRCESSIRTALGGGLKLNDPGDSGIVIRVETLHSEEGFTERVPRDLWIEVTGSAPSLDTAVRAFSMLAARLMPLLAFATNAPADDPEVFFALETTPGLDEHEFFQNFKAEQRGMIRQGRPLPLEATGALIWAAWLHPDNARVTRCILHYQEALRHWRPGRETFALAHLFMAAESLTKAVVRSECARVNGDEAALCEDWGIDIKNLDSEVRRRIIFGGDTPTYNAAKKASDGFEHGYLAPAEVYAHALAARDMTARHVRGAVLRLIGLPEPHLTTLTSTAYVAPAETWEHRMSGTGRWKGPLTNGQADCPTNFPHLYVEEVSISSLELAEDGTFLVEVGLRSHPVCGPETQPTPGTAWAQGPEPQPPPKPQ